MIRKTYIPAKPRNKKLIGTGGSSGISSSMSGAVANSHTHSNKSVIDQLTQADINVLEKLSLVDGNLKIDANAYSTGDLSAFGLGEEEGGGVIINVIDNLTSTSKTDSLSANMGRYLKTLIDNIEVGEGGQVIVDWEAITGKPDTFAPSAHSHIIGDVTGLQGALDDKASLSQLDDKEDKFTKNTAFNKNFGTGLNDVARGNHTHEFESLTSIPTTLAGYGITDAYTKTDVNDLLSNKADKATKITAGDGLIGGGTLASDRTLSVNFGTAAGTVAEGNHTHNYLSLNISRPTVDLNTLYTSGIAGGGSSTTNRPIGSHAFSPYMVMQSSLDRFVQLWFDSYGGNNIYYRNGNNSVWGDWVTLHHTGNFNPSLKLDKSVFDDLFEKVEVSSGVFAIKAKYNLFSVGEISAFGLGEEGGGSGGGSMNMLDTWANYTTEKANYYVPASLLVPFRNETLNRLSSIEGGSASEIATTGTGNAITSVSKSGSLLTFNKGLEFSLSSHTHPISDITNLQTALNNKLETTVFDTHNDDNVRHITGAERTKWNGVAGDFATHIANDSNPHSVTKGQVGLSNVPNIDFRDYGLGVDVGVIVSDGNVSPTSNNFSYAGGSNAVNLPDSYSALISLKRSDYAGYIMVNRLGTLHWQAFNGSDVAQGWRRAWDNVNFTPSDYVKKSGDTMTGNLTAPDVLVGGVTTSDKSLKNFINTFNSMFELEGDVIRAKKSLYSDGEISAFGAGDSEGGGGGSMNMMQDWAFTTATENYYLPAKLAVPFYINTGSRLSTLEAGTAPLAHSHNASDINAGVLDIARIPTGTTSSTVALGNHTHSYLPLSGGDIRRTFAGWPNDINSDASNYINQRIFGASTNNNALYFFGDGDLNARRFGIQSSHESHRFASAFGILELNPFGGVVKINGTTAATVNSNVASATKLQAPRTIAGVSFDGSANINIPFNNLTSKPTTLAEYGITDATSLSIFDTHNTDNIRHITGAERTKWDTVVTDFGNLEIGGRNLLMLNPIFWQRGAIASATGVVASSTTRLANIIGNEIGGAVPYVVEFYSPHNIFLFFYDENDNYLGFNGWLTERTFGVTPAGTKKVKFTVAKSDNSTIVVDDILDVKIKLEKGNKSTDWTPAPEDVQASIDLKANLASPTFTGVVTAPKISFGNGWTAEGVGAELQFKLNGVIQAKIVNGALVSTGEVIAHQ